MAEHGISNGRVIKDYRLGIVTQPLAGDERFKGMLAIPYLSRNGVKAIRFRNLNGTKPKFAQHEGQATRLYNTAAYFAASDVIGLTEGEIDAIAATVCLGIPTIGIPGAEMWTAHKAIWAPIFKNFARVLVFTDGDEVNPQTGRRPGEELGKAIRESLGWRAQVIGCPVGEDVSSMIAAGREKELTERIARVDDDDEDQ